MTKKIATTIQVEKLDEFENTIGEFEITVNGTYIDERGMRDFYGAQTEPNYTQMHIDETLDESGEWWELTDDEEDRALDALWVALAES